MADPLEQFRRRLDFFDIYSVFKSQAESDAEVASMCDIIGRNCPARRSQNQQPRSRLPIACRVYGNFNSPGGIFNAAVMVPSFRIALAPQCVRPFVGTQGRPIEHLQQLTPLSMNSSETERCCDLRFFSNLAKPDEDIERIFACLP